MKSLSELKVAIVCDWLTGIGGAERVVLELHKIFPNAPIYTSQYDPGKINWFADADVRTTWLQKLPSALKKFLPVLRAWSFSRLNLSEYDLVISTGGAESKFIKTNQNRKQKTENRKQSGVMRKPVHVYYCYAPTHYYWSRYDEYMKSPGFGAFNWLARLGLKILVGPMRRWDYKASQRPDYIIGISSHIQKEIKKYYDRDAALIHPPVDTARFQLPAHSLPAGRQGSKLTALRHGYVVAGRQVPYKRHDLAVVACTKLNLPLTVIGNGPEHERLVKMAGPTIEFVTDASDADVARYFAEAEAFIFPGLDDFGIVAVEAMAAGTPVIAYKAGGAPDYVIPGKTGEFFPEQTVESLVQTLKTFNSATFEENVLAEKVRDFSQDKFRDNMYKFINNNIDRY